MKNYILILGIVITLVFTVSSCEDDLNQSPESSITTENFYQTEADIDQAVVGAYAALAETGQYGFNYMMFFEIRADDAFVESPTNTGGEFGEFDLFSLTPGNSQIEETWESCYRGIQRCNIVLNRIDGIEMDASKRETRIGEVKFMRALTYFNLVRLWGDVPLVIQETENPFDFFDVGRTPESEVYNQIITDLTEAIDGLPNTASEEGRATKGAAQTLLGKVYLTQQNWAMAATTLSQVSGYSLNPSFETNFGIANENGVESIFEIQYDAGLQFGSRYPNEVAPVGSQDELLNGIGSQRGENIPSDDLFNSFETGDARRDASIGVLMNGTTKYAKKLIDIPVSDYNSSLNIIVFRYAEVLLMQSEALNEQGYAAGGEAFGLLNQIRNRAGLASFTSADLPNQSSFREAVYTERRHEFVSEFQRWPDLVRTGRAVTVMNASSSAFTVSENQLIFPLPLSAIDTMNNPNIFPQNPGY